MKKNKKKFDRSKFKDGLRKRMKTGQQKMQGMEPTQLILPEDVNLYVPKPGDHTIDILPYIAGSNDPMTKEGDPTYTCQYLVHKDVGPQKKWYVCPEQYSKDCPICEERRRLMDEGHDKDVWKHLYPRERNLYNVIVYDSREEEKKGVQIFDVATFYMEENLLKIANKKTKRRSSKSKSKSIEPFVDFASPDRDGKVITFSIEPAKSKDSYPQYGGHAFEDRDYDIEDDLLDGVHVLDEFLIVPEYKELKSVFKKGNEEKEEEDDSNEDEEPDDEDIDDDEDEEENLKKMRKRMNKPIKKKKDKKVKDEDEEDSDDEDGDEELEDDISFEDEEDEEPECEYGYRFGIDTNKYDECEDECDGDIWKACLKEKKKNKDKKGKKRKR